VWGTLYDIFQKVDGQNDLFVEIADQADVFKTYFPPRHLANKKHLDLLLGGENPIRPVQLFVLACLKDRSLCKSIFPRTRFHWGDPRLSTKGKVHALYLFEKYDLEGNPIYYMDSVEEREQFVLLLADMLRNDHILEDPKVVEFAGAPNVWQARSPEAKMCQAGCHRIRKQLQGQSPTFISKFYDFFEARMLDMTKTSVNFSPYLNAILLDMYTMARAFKYKDQKNVFIYAGDWHARNIREFLRFLEPDARVLQYDTLASEERCLDTTTHAHVIS
jgi:hypothetical protein